MSCVFHFLIAVLKLIPVFLSFCWIFGAFIFYWRRERNVSREPFLQNPPPVSIIVPCHDEESTVGKTVAALDGLDYPEYEILAVNDGSTDRTRNVLEALAAERPRMRVIHLLQNRGKAAALNVGILASRYDHVICTDADAEMDAQAPSWLMTHLMDNSNIGAVTGNPRVKNRSTLLGRIQVGEFSAIIGIIKRYHQVIGKLFALSGVIIAFKKRALIDIGLLDTDCLTEDIAVTWKLQRAGWDVRYEPHALCDVLMPDTLRGLWRQRMRWARGGFEVMTRNCDLLLGRRQWALKILFFEYFMSVIWTLILPVVLVGGVWIKNPQGVPILVDWISPFAWSVFLTGMLSALQFSAGFWVHGRYEKGAGRFGYWAIWYPFVYWMLNSAVLFVAIPRTLFGKRKKFSTWVSPDRGRWA